MNAYLVPVWTALLAAASALAVLGAIRFGRWVRDWRRGPRETPWTPGPAIAGHRVDPNVSRLAQRTLGAALFLGIAANLFFAVAPARGAFDPASIAMALSLLVIWAASLRTG